MASTYAAQTQAAISKDVDDPTDLSPTPTIEETDEPTATSTIAPTLVGPVGPYDFPENINPLTGLYVSDPAVLDRRPVLVKVANYPASGRPHAGLSAADMVFEYYIGFGGNRFVGLYYGQDATKIGPLRSGRLIDPYLTTLYEGILGFQSAYVTILDHIIEILGRRAISGSVCPAICDDGRNIVISVFADSAELTKLSSERGVENRRYTLEGMAFDPQAPQGGEVGEQATILFAPSNRGDWEYDEDSGKYLRWIEDMTSGTLEMIPLVDSETDEQLAFSNVIVLFANHTEIADTIYDVDMWNSVGRRAIIFRDGQAYDLTWTTPGSTQPIQFIGMDGEIFPLKPGNTWIAIMGVYSDITEDEGNWTFNFQIP
jgi:hypothetical protein